MKKILILALCTLVLTGCSSSKAHSNESNKSSSHSSQTTTKKHIDTEAETKTEAELKTESETETEFIDKDFDDILSKAKDTAKKISKVTSGPFYDNVTSICSDLSISESNDCVYIAIDVTPNDSEQDCISFYRTMTNIITDSKLENYHNNAIFTMRVNSQDIGMVCLTDFNSPNDFSSTIFSFDSSYKLDFENIYNYLFSSYDIANQFDSSLSDLSDKYGLN